MNTEQGFAGLVRAVRWRWAVCLLVALPLALGVGAYAAFAPAQYDGRTTVAFSPRLSSVVGADVISVVLPRYVALLSTDSTVRAVSARTGIDESVVAAAKVSIETASANLTVTVHAEDAAAAARAANALAAVALDASKDDELLQAQQVGTALPSDRPASPPRALLVIAGLLAGLVAGTVAAVLAERLHPRVRDRGDVLATGPVDVLGRIPVSSGLRTGSTDAAGDPVVRSAIRGVVTRVEQAAGPDGAACVAITSPTGGHGRSTVAVAYAATAARQGRRVVLLDTGRGPGEGSSGADLVAALDGDLSSLLVDGVVPGVRVLPVVVDAGTVDLVAHRLTAVLAELRQEADLVVVDGPAMDQDGAEALLARLPAVVVVVRAGTPQATVTETGEALAGLGNRVLGIVLEDLGRRPGRSRADRPLPSAPGDVVAGSSAVTRPAPRSGGLPATPASTESSHA